MQVAIRVDASAEIGSGHLMRCLTLANTLSARGAAVRFICRDLPVNWQALIRASGHQLAPLTGAPAREDDGLAHSHWLRATQAQDAAESAAVLSDAHWDWLVVDHYALDARWETALRSVARQLLVIDDLADRSHDCDLLLDQNLYSDMDARYAGKVPASCRVLLGPRYALLRPEFLEMRGRRSRSGAVGRVLISFGGVDARNFTAAAIEAVAALRGTELQADVVIGAQHPHRGEVEAACAAQGFACHVQTERMAELMLAADLAIGAGGGAAWERCCLGLPALVLCAADNQRRQIMDAAINGLWYAPDFTGGEPLAAAIERHVRSLLDNSLLRAAISHRGMEVVDGRGTLRVVAQMDDGSIAMREAVATDCRQLFEWRNHPSIRGVSQNHDELDWARHQQWLAAVLNDPERALLIGERHGAPVGVIRFDCQGSSAEVSLYVVPGVSEPGTGSALLRAAERWIAARRPLQRIQARVLAGNEASHRLFAACGYRLELSHYSKRLRLQ
jgi:UDP-2,4-diacetamido-2,4,6-trideoxy-beta-L-altropyranose hydrolase